MNTRAPMIEARNLSVGYGVRTVLDAVDLTIHSGEFWFLLGANGVGKTTFVRAVLGLVPPRSGELNVDPSLLGQRRVGYVPQRSELNPTLRTTVREFVRLGLLGLSVSRQEADSRLAHALGLVGLEAEERSDYWSLSGGMRQRALLARALIRAPSLLILDEPTAGLDPAVEVAFSELLVSLNEEHGATIVVVSHDLDLASRYASHIGLFRGGRVVSGTRDGVLESGQVEKIYGSKVSHGDPHDPSHRSARGTM